MEFTKHQIIEAIRQTRLVPLFTHDNPEEAEQVLKTAYESGVRVFEFTNRSSNAYDVFVHLVGVASKYSDLMIGIGTIMDAATTEKFIKAGANFIISPILKLEMASMCNRYEKLWIPGCATMTEIAIAKENGADIIKVFPGSVLGPGFVSSVLPIIPDLKLMITGGVEPNEKSLSAWFNAGAFCVGLGSQLFTKEIMTQKNWPLLKQKIEHVLELAKALRN